MRNLTLQTGGAPFFVETLETLQAQTLLTQSAFAGSARVLSGCFVSGASNSATISAGTIFLDGEIKEFAGATGVDFVANPTQYIKSAPVSVVQKNYETGGAKTYFSDFVAELSTSTTPNTGFSDVLAIRFTGVDFPAVRQIENFSAPAGWSYTSVYLIRNGRKRTFVGEVIQRTGANSAGFVVPLLPTDIPFPGFNYVFQVVGIRGGVSTPFTINVSLNGGIVLGGNLGGTASVQTNDNFAGINISWEV